MWNAPDEELIARAKREIGEIGLMDPADVHDACVVRQKKAYPVYDETYADHMKEIRRELALSIPTCISSAATACTNITTRTMR